MTVLSSLKGSIRTPFVIAQARASQAPNPEIAGAGILVMRGTLSL